jgi:PKD repeat protein
MEDTNELIAEFMGMQDTDLGWYDSEEAMSEYACQIVGGSNTFEVLQYDRSWDWLMPVVQKCYKIEDEEGFDNLVDAVATLDMYSTYNAVVEFIKQQNKNK